MYRFITHRVKYELVLEGLTELNLFSLEQMRLRRDMIQVYKILTGLDAVPSNSYSNISSNTRN